MNHSLEELDHQIMNAFIRYKRYLDEGTFNGREREAVSFFSFGYLAEECKTGKPLADKLQIGIEVAIPQIESPNRKPQVCKDIVIWPKPGMTCWDNHGQPSLYPLAVMEWKVNQRFKSQRDLNWLIEYTTLHAGLIGYRVHQAPVGGAQTLQVDFVYRGSIIPRNVA